MTPRKDSHFYKLSPQLKALYLTGMPAQFLKDQQERIDFKGEKVSKGMLTASAQRKAYEEFQKIAPENQHFALFHSSPADLWALQAVCELLKSHHKKGFSSFEFVSASEPLPKEERVKALYIVLGAHTQDDSYTQMIRRWVRAPLGASVWVVSGGNHPWVWTQEKLGIKPDFLFSVVGAGISVG